MRYPFFAAVWLVAGSLAVATASRASSAPSATPAATFFTDGTVLATAATNDRIYVGGDFSLIGAATGSWVQIGPDGNPVGNRPFLAGEVSAAVPDGRGGWFVAGAIAAVGTVGRSAKVVHLKAGGELDRSWHVSVGGGPVTALAVSGKTLLLGGGFKTVGGKPRRALAAVSVARGRLLGWRLHGYPRYIKKGKPAGAGTITTLAVSGSTLYVGGSFGQIGGSRREDLAAIGVRTGRATVWNPSPNSSVAVIRPSGSTVYVAGSFSRIGGAARNGAAALNATSGRSRSFNAHAPAYATISDLVVGPSAVYLAGDFSSLGGRSRHLLAAVDRRTGAVTPWESSISGDEVDTLALDVSRNTLYLAGELEEVGGQRRDTLAAVDTRSGEVTAWDPRALGDIAVLSARPGGVVFAGGDIEFVGGLRRHGLAAITPAGGLTDWDPNLDGIVRALAFDASKSRLYVGGAFAPGDVPSQRNLAVVDTATGVLRAFGGGTNSGVWTIAPSVDGSMLFIGGAFVTVAGKRRTRLAALDPATGALLSWNSGANDLVRVVLPASDSLYVGGDFTSAGGLSRPRLVKLDLDSGAALGWSPEPDDKVWALELRDETLYVGGEFGQIGGKSRNGLAAINVESEQASSWDPNADGTVRALRASGDRTRLYAGGEFEKIGTARRSYAEFSLPQGSLTGWSPTSAFDAYSISLTPDGSVLVFAGDGGLDVFRT